MLHVCLSCSLSLSISFLYRSSLLTDKLLRLLSLISLGQPEVVKRHEELESSGATSSEQVQVRAGIYILENYIV